jgi:phosphomevalonate kinase
MDSSPYKEMYRHDMIVWSEAIRSRDPGYFCRLAVSEAKDPIWLISDARRLSDMQFFEEKHGTVLLTVRVHANEETRKTRGWAYNKVVDDSTSECGLDEFKCHININNSLLPEDNLTLQLEQILSWIKNKIVPKSHSVL